MVHCLAGFEAKPKHAETNTTTKAAQKNIAFARNLKLEPSTSHIQVHSHGQEIERPMGDNSLPMARGRGTPPRKKMAPSIAIAITDSASIETEA